MLGDVLDPLAVNVDLAAVAQQFQKLRAGERALFVGKDRFGMLWHDPPLLSFRAGAAGARNP